MFRVQAFEFNERPECPRLVREAIVEALGRGLRWGGMYEPAGPVFAEFVRRARCDSVLDLCSGSGEPVSILLEALARSGTPAPRFALSDLFPNIPAMERVAARHRGLVEVVREPVDATAVPERFDRAARTIVSALHHFPPEAATRILADCVRKRRAVFVLEAFPRELLKGLSILPAMTAAAAANPFCCERDRLAKFALTYLTPAIFLAGGWDALVSMLRVHTEAELGAMVAPLGGGYVWEYRRLPWPPFGCSTAFFGLPPGRDRSVDAA